MQNKVERPILGWDSIALVLICGLHLALNKSLFPPWSRIFRGTKESLDTLILLGLPQPADKLGALLPDPVRWFLIGLVVFLVVLYLVVDLAGRTWEPVSRLAPIGRRVILGFIIWYAVANPLIAKIYLRQTVNSARFAHDGGVIQTELAMKFLAEGKNPYRESYKGTLMSRSAYSQPSNWRWMKYKGNPALEHYPYLPLTALAGMPLKGLVELTGLTYDQRYLYLIGYLLLLFAVIRLIPAGETRRGVVILLLLNPLLVGDLVRGYNDILTLSFLGLSVWGLAKQRYLTAALLLGLACATKPFAWLLVPFLAAQIWSTCARPGPMELLRKSWPLIIAPLVIILPFLIWDAPAFWSDVVAFNAGSASDLQHRYPIKGFNGYGFGTVVLYFGWVDRVQSSFPFAWIQLAAIAPIVLLGVRRLARRGSLSEMLVWYGVALAVFFLFARFFHLNYLTFMVSVLILGLGLQHASNSSQSA